MCSSVGHVTFESNFISAYSPEAFGVSSQLSFASGLEAENRKIGTWNPKSFLCKYTQTSGLLCIIATVAQDLVNGIHLESFQTYIKKTPR